MSKHMLRAFGLSLLAALGLMAFAAAGAQAEELKGTPGGIRILGISPSGGEAVLGEQIGASTVLIPALNTELVCQKVKVLSGKVIAEGKGLAEFLNEECAFWGTKTVKHASGVELLELTTKMPCEILEEGTLAKGAIISKSVFTVVLHEKDTYTLVESDPVGGAHGAILITTPSECPLPKLTSVTGSTVSKVTSGDLALGGPEELKVVLTSSKFISKLFSDKLLFGTNEMFIDASVALWLASDCKWGMI